MSLRATAAALFGAAAVIAGCGSKAPVDTTGLDVAANLKTVAGLPQKGITLGSPDAEYTLTVFDSMDSFSRGFFTSDLPTLVQQYVRSGRMNVELQTVTSLGAGRADDADATAAARLAQAAAQQKHLWDFYGALSARYVGTIDQGVLDLALGDVPAIDATRARADAKGTKARDAITAANQEASDDSVPDLPYYTLTKGFFGSPVRLDASCQGCLVRSVAKLITGRAPTATPSATPTPSPAPGQSATGSAVRVGREVGSRATAPSGKRRQPSPKKRPAPSRTAAPTAAPRTSAPVTPAPTSAPTRAPISVPTRAPTTAPTRAPTSAPTKTAPKPTPKPQQTVNSSG